MPRDHRDELRQIRTFPQLVTYLRDELDWPIEADAFDDLTFDYEPEDLGLYRKTTLSTTRRSSLPWPKPSG